MWALLLASQWPDWVQLALQALGAWNAELYSHSIPAIIGGSLLFSLIFLRHTGDMRSSFLVAAVYLTHPLLDLITGKKPLWPGGPPIGENWYDHPAKDFLLEALLLCAAWMVYRSVLDRRRNASLLWGMLAALLACQALLDVGQQLRLLHRASSQESGSMVARPAPSVHISHHCVAPLSPIGSELVPGASTCSLRRHEKFAIFFLPTPM